MKIFLFLVLLFQVPSTVFCAVSFETQTAIRQQLWALYNAQQPNANQNYLPAKVIRLAFHDAITYRTATKV